MGFLRRVFGGRSPGEDEEAPASPASPASPADHATIEAEERARELELARFDQDRLDDLVRRQQRYADRSWTPPAQGSERRADDGDVSDQ
ncbi:MAG: hypothetical protein H0V73_07620 [Chloroflexi bacterium]|nr:hypothetical protein [Chloroflexota bacterium]